MTANDMTDDIQAAKPWYKQPWLWFILTPLIAVFIYGFTFLYLSIVTMDGVVKDDYYRNVRSYEVNSEKNLAAIEKNISATLNLDDVTGDLMLKLSGNFEELPPYLTLGIVHPTHQKYDQSITLKSVGSQGLFSGSLSSPISGKRYLYLTPPTETWSLRTEVHPPYEQRLIELMPSK